MKESKEQHGIKKQRKCGAMLMTFFKKKGGQLKQVTQGTHIRMNGIKNKSIG